MIVKIRLLTATLLTAATLVASAADARSIKWTRSGDALTLDPHAQNESPTTNVNRQIYEPLVERDRSGKLVPTLAVSWRITEDPSVWEFKLRQGVKFHNGNPFDADDVVFTFERARHPTSDFKGYITSVESLAKVNSHTVHIKTKGPNPILVENLTYLLIMDKEWSEANNAAKPQDFKNKEENFAVRNANGTGPFALVSREPDVKTVFKRNDGYWGRGEVPLEITELVLNPIKADATRVAALLSGEVDFVQDVPVQDIERLKSSPNLSVTTGPENRTIFFGMDVGAPQLKIIRRQGQEPVRRVAGAAGDEHGDQPRGDPARRHAHAVGAGRRDRAPLRQRLHQGARHLAARRRGESQGAAGRSRLSERILDQPQLPERPLFERRSDLPGRRRHARPDRHQG